MYQNLDHDDFKKARKALVIASISLLVLQNLQIIDGNIQISELKFKVEKDLMVTFAMYATIYFLMVFSGRSFIRILEHKYDYEKSLFEEKITELKASVDMALKSSEKKRKPMPQAKEYIERFDELMNSLGKRTSDDQFVLHVFNRSAIIWLEVVPAILIALTALISLVV